ncbi:MFS transporter [Opitutus sp. ER46]|uniref:MFS transporter n=1 Tax=Opitutus sp. ER46 TaxID=2161864 RepID=UPI000D325923|nr:MFS transporter [Opitutus sp. ER46]PTX90780.1 MFS transporter [Opitutus sp. ER46]
MKKLLWLAVGTFAIGTEGYAIAGLLPSVAADVGVTVPVAGQLITAFSLAFALGSPLLAVVTGNIERRRVLLTAIAAFGAFNLLAAVAHTYAILFVARVGMALAAAAFMPAASAYAVATTPAARRGEALSVIYSGLTLAMLAGAPIGVLVGGRLGWRFIFLAAAAVSLLTLVGLAATLVRGAATHSATLRERLAVARRPAVLHALLLTVVVMTGVFTLFTYIAPFVRQATGVTGDGEAIVFLLFGIGATIGNLRAGRLADRIGPFPVLVGGLVGLSATYALLSGVAVFAAPQLAWWLILPALAFWGVFGFAVGSGQQVRLASIQPRLAPITLSLNASAGYIGVSLGAVLGSLVVARGAIADLGWVAASCEAAALGLLLLTRRSFPRRKTAPDDEPLPELARAPVGE